jgi:hypothetical protein
MPSVNGMPPVKQQQWWLITTLVSVIIRLQIPSHLLGIIWAVADSFRMAISGKKYSLQLAI